MGGESAGTQPASGQLSSFELGERTALFTGRGWVFEKLDLWAGVEDGRAFILTGGPGTGKSAIAARLAQMSAGEAPFDGYPNLGKGALAHGHFCRALDVSLDPLRFVEGLSASLATNPAFAEALLAATGPDVRIEATQRVDRAESGAQVRNVVIDSLHVGNLSPRVAFDRTVRKPLEALYGSGFDHQLLVLVDGLDEALTYAAEDNLVTLLGDVLDHPAELPGRVRFIVSTRPDPRVLAAVGQPALDIESEAAANENDVRAYAHGRLSPLSEPARTEVASKVAEAGEGNFLYARYVVESLLTEPDPAAVDPTKLRLPKGLEGHYRDFVSRELTRNRERWEDRYRPLLGALAVARGAGLTAAQAAHVIELPEDRTHDALQACTQYLIGPDSLGRYRIYHQSFREFLLGDPVYRVFPAVANERIAAYLLNTCGGSWETCGDHYALAFATTHLSEAIRQVDDSVKRAKLASELMSLVRDPGFLKALDQVGAVATPLSDLEQALVATALDEAPPMVPPVIEGALTLTALRRHYLQPEAVIEFAKAGDLEAVERRLESFSIDQAWRQAVLLASAWLAADANKPGAAAVLQRVRSSLLGYDPLPRLAERVSADVLKEAFTPPGLPPSPPLEKAQQIVARMGGIDPRTHPSMLWEYDLPPGEQILPATRGLRELAGREIEQAGDYEPIFAAEVEGPVLVSFAAANPGPGDRLVREYIRLHAANTYVSYRNRSLWALLRSIVQHPSQNWVKDMVVDVTAGALVGDTLEFEDCLGLARLALCAEVGDAECGQVLNDLKYAQELAAHDLSGRSLSPGFDSWGEHKRRLGALAEAFAVGLRDRHTAATLVELAFRVPYGFAGYTAPVCLTLAESALICLDDASAAVPGALDLSQSSAHNVQDPVFCARTTSRWNAMALEWWPREGGRLVPLDIAGVVDRFVSQPGAADFSPFHVVGETYGARSADPASVPMPGYMRSAATLAELADRVYEYPLSEFMRLNEDKGWEPERMLPPGTVVRVPDAGFAPLLAARLSAEALVSGAIQVAERRRFIQRLVPVAAGSPTCLDTVLGRLLLAARPPGQVLDDLQKVLQRYPRRRQGGDQGQQRLEVLLGRLYPAPSEAARARPDHLH